MTEPILTVRDLSVDLTGKTTRRLLSNVSFEIGDNEVLGVIGESGAGKTVLSRALVRWLPSTMRQASGSMLYRGQDLSALSEPAMAALRGREISYIGANPGVAMNPTLSIGSQLVSKLMAVEPGIGHARAKARVLETLDAVRIPSHVRRFDDFPYQFSGGMMQRVMIVDALVARPRLHHADNITQPLDVTVAGQILKLLRDLQADFNASVLFVSSSLGILTEIAGRIMVLNQGAVVETQPTADLVAHPAHAYTKRLIARMPRIWTSGARVPDAAPPPADNEAVLSVRGIARTYVTPDRSTVFGKNRVQAVRGVSFEARPRESLGIIGESGCGKSTLSRLLSALEAPDEGQILYRGKDMSKLSRAEMLKVRREFQLLLQDPFSSIPPHWPIGRIIAEALRIQGGVGRKEIERRVKETMTEVGLDPGLYDSFPTGLSAGQRQRVNIARAMILQPKLLILDETLSALDQVEQGKLLELFAELQRRHGITYIFISHDLSMVRMTCNRIAVMYLGRIVELADNEETFLDPRHPYTRTLLSAVPVVEDRPYGKEDYLLDGEPPDPVSIPPGCSFRTRCAFAHERCKTVDPALRPARPGDEVACNLIGAGPEVRQMPVTPTFAATLGADGP